MNYRPIVDTWILARPKVKYYGALPSGFLERGRALLGIGPNTPLLHVCSGKVKEYPFRGLGQNDFTLDANPDLSPDFVVDLNKKSIPLMPESGKLWPAILADPPYSEDDAENYSLGRQGYPTLTTVSKRCWEALRPGGRYGVLHYLWARPPATNARPVALITIYVGWGNRARTYTVYEKEQ